jgi:hypothetical protein
MAHATRDSRLDNWITGNYGEDRINTDEHDEAGRGPNRRYNLETADGTLTFIFCSRCVTTTTTWVEADGELAEAGDPCAECGWTGE